MEPIVLTNTNQELSDSQREQLEGGRVLLFPSTPLDLAEHDCQFLLSQHQSRSVFRKNIAYRPLQHRVTGVAMGSQRQRLRLILRDYCLRTARFLARLLPQYAKEWRLDFTSFRPLPEEGRLLSLHARNDLVHIDAFPTRPTNGDRILRFFTNINPKQPRVWLTSDPFHTLAERFAGAAGLVEAARQRSSSLRQAIALIASSVHLRQLSASPYDVLMHRFHNFLKENHDFQESCPKTRVEFPPKSSWLVFTDSASHAVLSGQFALEQTFIVPRRALLAPEQAPVSVLERLAGVPLTWNE